MVTTLNQFIEGIKSQGLAQPNRFSVLFTPPLGVDTTNLKEVLMMCTKVSMPGVSFAADPVRTYGESRQAPYDKVYVPARLTFIVRANLYEKKLFDAWMNFIRPDETRAFAYYQDYISDMQVGVISQSDKSAYTMTMLEAYPKSVGEIQFDQSNINVPMTLDVDFQYRLWVPNLDSVGTSSNKVTSLYPVIAPAPTQTPPQTPIIST